MPSFNYPVPNNPQPERKLSVTDKEFSHTLVDTKVQPLNSLITHVAGASRIVDYYSQVITSNSDIQKYSKGLSAPLQQYKLIKDLEIKQNDFGYSFDSENQEASGTGTAILYPPLIPNAYDVFVADIGNGQVGLFTVSEIEKKSIFKQACYEITYELEFLLNSQTELDLLNQKVVETYYFVKDFILYGQNPLLVESEFNLIQDSKRILAEAIDDYLTEFYSRELTCLAVPGFSLPTYDPFATKAFLEVVETSTLRRAMKINIRNTDELKEYWYNSIWVALINPSQHQHRSIWKRARPDSVRSYNTHPRINSIRFSGFDQVIRPIDKLENVDAYYRLNVNNDKGFYGYYGNGVNAITVSGTRDPGIVSINGACWCKVQDYYHNHHVRMTPWDPQNHLAHLSQWQHSCHDPDCPCVCHTEQTGDEITDTNSYIFGASFYDDDIASADGVEQLVKTHLANRKVDPALVNKLLLERASWTPKERYYKMLVLIIILISAIRSF